MAQHKKQRSIDKSCPVCGTAFVTGSAIKTYCSPECDVICVASRFDDREKCWEWPRSKNPQTGYGQINRYENGRHKVYTAHRISFSAHFGDIPDGLQVLHRCDNKPCINPSHLFLGTQLDNMADMMEKGRGNHTGAKVHWTKTYPEKVKRGNDHPSKAKPEKWKRGSGHYASKITEADVIEIRGSTETLLRLSERFGISQSALSAIKKRKTWAHLP